MNIRKMAELAVVLGLVMVWTASAYAAGALYTCKVVNAGPVTRDAGASITPQVQVRLTRVSGNPAWSPATLDFKAVNGQEKQMLAVALTALVNGRNVEAYLDPAAGVLTVYNLKLK